MLNQKITSEKIIKWCTIFI